MPKVRIKEGLTNIQLPDGVAYDGGDIVNLSQAHYDAIASSALGDEVLDYNDIREIEGDEKFKIYSFPIELNDIADGDLTTFTPGFAGSVVGWQAVATTPATTASKLSTLNLEIGSTDVGTSPSTIALTTAGVNAAGKVVAGAAVSGANTFDNNDIITLEAASTTAFVEGKILVQVFLLAN